MSSTNIYTSSTNIPIYVSLTSIFKNQDILLQTLTSIINQSKLPDKMYIYLSEQPSFFDNGFKDKKITNSNLLKLINDHPIINILWGKDIGPYGKLLPILKQKWNEDCFIITIDDDTIYHKNLIENLVNDYNKQKCVISYRTFTQKFKTYDTFIYKNRHAHKQYISLYNFATGKGGILYKPEFFHKTNDLIFNDKVFLKTCDKQDDIWFYIVRLLNNVEGYLGNEKWQIKDLTNNGLHANFNTNASSLKKTLKKIKELEYTFS